MLSFLLNEAMHWWRIARTDMLAFRRDFFDAVTVQMVAECSAETSVTIYWTTKIRIAKRRQAAQNVFTFKIQGKEMRDRDCNFLPCVGHSS
jgi:hypothetical protein